MKKLNEEEYLIEQEDIDNAKIETYIKLPNFLVTVGACSSNSEGKRLMIQKGVKINGMIEDVVGLVGIHDGSILSVGKRFRMRIVNADNH